MMTATEAARECGDDYKKSAVRAWEIAALAERKFTTEARKSLSEALAIAKCAQPMSSRSEALFYSFRRRLELVGMRPGRVYRFEW